MGCDIHMYAEILENGEWRAIGRIFRNDDYTEDILPKIDVNSDNSTYCFGEPYTEHPYDDRDYNLFAILANVRNSEKIPYISEPRGLPKDVSGYVKIKSDYWGIDGHSHSYLTLDELSEFTMRGDNHKRCYQTSFFHINYPNLLRLEKKHGKIRIVFWFDNNIHDWLIDNSHQVITR